MPALSSLIMDPFASHVVRALLVLLAPHAFNTDDTKSSLVRSKKSAAYKARQGSMKSVFSDSQEQGEGQGKRRTPKEFRQAAQKFVAALRDQLGENEVRSLAANQVASPVLQVQSC